MPQLPNSARRRAALGTLGALSAAPFVGFAGSAEAAWAEEFDAADIAAARSCALIPQETAGPYPLLQVLKKKFIRRDVTEGKPGVPLTLTLKVVDINAGCAPISNAAVYIWCTDKDGVYSGYVQPGGIDTRGETFMRGIQLSDSKGLVQFAAIYPGWYPGRITHIHFQVYLDADLGGSATATSQLAFPQKVTRAVYASELYKARGQNTSVTDFDHDGVFSDGHKLQLCSTKGSVDAGYAAKLLVGVAV